MVRFGLFNLCDRRNGWDAICRIDIMNRIREFREGAGLTGEELAKRVGTSAAQIYKLERGERRLTVDWLAKLAESLECTAPDLIANSVATAMQEDEVTPNQQVDPALASAMAARGLRAYRVDSSSVPGAKIGPGDTIVVDHSTEAVTNVKTGDIVLVQLECPSVKVLRGIFTTPCLTILLTLRSAANITISMGDPTVRPKILGVVVR
jgi:transcriptional regulator with XRE-family HTH domain